MHLRLTAKRVTARLIDITMVGFITYVVEAATFPELITSSVGSIAIAMLGQALWVPLEAGLIARGMPTPGKALLGLRVSPVGTQPASFSTALERTLGVWAGGFFFFMPIMATITSAYAAFGLVRNRDAFWDVEYRVQERGRAV